MQLHLFQPASLLGDSRKHSTPLLPPMIEGHIQSIPLFIGALVSGSLAQIARMAQVSPDVAVDKWIERGGTGLAIFLLFAAVVYLVRENKALATRIETLHTVQIGATERATEARVQQAEATEQTNKVISDFSASNKELASAVSKLAEKVKT